MWKSEGIRLVIRESPYSVRTVNPPTAGDWGEVNRYRARIAVVLVTL